LEIIKKETGEEAIILLDDVLSELDYERQGFLIEALSDNQIFISVAGMGREMMETLGESKVFNVENGGIN
jgi:DNA replication and repair protein RecF